MDSEDDERLIEQTLSDGRVVQVLQVLHGKARLCVGPAGYHGYDDTW